MIVNDLILLGKIVGTHGLRGELKVNAYAGASSALLTVKSVIVQATSGTGETMTVSGVRMNGKKLLLSIKGFSSINQVQHLLGRELLIHREQLPAPDDDEYYWHDLIGLKVFTDSGRLIGTLTEIMETGSNDVYVVKDNHQEFLIPALADVVTKIDLTDGVMIISPMDGLLDL
jgi:16S rRNA processing protein RimM